MLGLLALKCVSKKMSVADTAAETHPPLEGSIRRFE